MTKERINTTQGACMVALTKHIMKQSGISQNEAYKRLLESELYSLIMDEETGLYLEPNQDLCVCYDIEQEGGVEALYERINE